MNDVLSGPSIARTKPILVTGGAGFIGCNLADRLATDGHDVLIFDSLTRTGAEENLAWLKRRHHRLISPMIAEAAARPLAAALTTCAMGSLVLPTTRTPGTSVAREVGHRLGWTVYDHELLERVATDIRDDDDDGEE